MTLQYRELKRRYELDGAAQTVKHLSEALSAGHLEPHDFSIRDLAEALVPDGREWVRLLDPRSAGSVSLLEAGDGVDVTAFLNITGQVIYSKIMEAYTQEAFVVSKLVDTIPTRLDGEKIPGIARVADAADAVGPGMPYPHLGFGEDYIETPSTTKRGFIVPVGGAAAAKRLSHASGLTRAAQPAVAMASVAKFDIVGVCVLLFESRIAEPQPPVWRSTRLGTLPAAILRPSNGPLTIVPSRNWLWVHTDAMVVSSLTTTCFGGLLPSTAMKAIAGLSP